MPSTSARSEAQNTSSSVAGNRSPIRRATGTAFRYEMPNSPWMARPTKRTNWIGAGIVEAELLAQCFALLRRAFGADHRVGRIADEIEQAEGEQRYRQHDDNRFQQSSHNEDGHRDCPS